MQYYEYQQRIVTEKRQLDERLKKLNIILTSEMIQSFPEDEQKRMKRQSEVMAEYSKILGERIAAF